jgi:DNA primase
MKMDAEWMKRMNLVDFLSSHYGLKFRRSGKVWKACSPFTDETKPSFTVHRKGNGHWLFKDFSGGGGPGGSIIDFVMLKENFSDTGKAIAHIRSLVEPSRSPRVVEARKDANGEKVREEQYDLPTMYEAIARNDAGASRHYLADRGIGEELVERLSREGLLLHNRHEGKSWCCFVVRDRSGTLKCLDNHEIGGDGKFVLGRKHVFSLDFDKLSESERVYVTEGIIDYLSMKEMLPPAEVGFALLGNQPIIEAELIGGCHELVLALDDDHGGTSGMFSLQERFPEKEIRVYDLEGNKDPNELLRTIKGRKRHDLSRERKMELYREFHMSENRSDLARKWGLDRTYLYDIIRECEGSMAEGLSAHKRGRPSSEPRTLAEALEQLKLMERERRHEAREKERWMVRSEFLKLRLKWSEIEVAEMRGEITAEEAESGKEVKKKRQLKKNEQGGGSPVD